jgi:hypothetical protein
MIAYFDEGAFGSGAGAAGLVARDSAGRKVWAYDAQKAGTDGIADVYAFNLPAEDTAEVRIGVKMAVAVDRMRSSCWLECVDGRFSHDSCR